jgi:Domain of unknown function (DUF4431)
VKIWTVTLFSLLLASFRLFSLPVHAAALHYEPAVVELTGTVVLDEYFGPPGFGEDPKTDSRELYAILVLDAPVSVEGVPGDLIDKTYPDVRRVQLVRGADDRPFSPYQGMHVVVSGTLYGRHTGHHHTDVLLIVQSIAAR